MNQELLEYLHVRHLVDPKKTGREHRPEKPYKKWKRRWVVLTVNVSPSKCVLNYCKKENQWLSNAHNDITRCQLASFSLEKVTGRGERDTYLVIALRAYSICLAFESVSKLDQWHCTLKRILDCYQVQLECAEHRDLEDEYVIQFCHPGQFRVWGTDDRLHWEWSLQDVRRVHYHQSADKFEIEVGRRSRTGEGKFFFTGQLVFKLFLAVKEAMKEANKRNVEEQRPYQREPSVSSLSDGARSLTSSPMPDSYSESISRWSRSSGTAESGFSIGHLSVVSAPEPSANSAAKPHHLAPVSPHHLAPVSPRASQSTRGEYMALQLHNRDTEESEYVEIKRDTGTLRPSHPSNGSIGDGEYIAPQFLHPQIHDMDDDDHRHSGFMSSHSLDSESDTDEHDN